MLSFNSSQLYAKYPTYEKVKIIKIEIKNPVNIDHTTNNVPNDNKRSQRSSGLFKSLTPIEYNENEVKENRMIMPSMTA